MLGYKVSKDHIEAVRRAFPADWLEREDSEAPQDWASDCLSWRAETVEEIFGWGDGEPFGVRIRGVPGAYFVEANEFDNVGMFSTLEEAREGRDQAYSGLDLFPTKEEVWAHAEERGYI